MKKAKVVLLSVILIIILIIILQNVKYVEIEVLFWTFTMPHATLLFITMMVGFVIGGIVAYMFRKKH